MAAASEYLPHAAAPQQQPSGYGQAAYSQAGSGAYQQQQQQQQQQYQAPAPAATMAEYEAQLAEYNRHLAASGYPPHQPNQAAGYGGGY
jgi:hypothetical protein